MSRILGSWSGMRKYLEKEMLAPCLQGRVRYRCTTYVGMDGCRVFEVFVDGAVVKRFSWETVNTYFIENGYKESREYHGTRQYWEGFTRLLEEVPPSERCEYTDEEFCEALEQYRSHPISQSLSSENALVRMFTILDRRVGRRTLLSLKDSAGEQPAWLREFYKLRLSAEAVEI